MRRSRDLIAVLLLLALFIVGGLLLGGRGVSPRRTVGAEDGRDPSVTNDRASGSRGVFEWAAKMGYKPTVWGREWSQL